MTRTPVDDGPAMAARNPAAFELFQVLVALAEDGGSGLGAFEAPREAAAFKQARDAFLREAGIDRRRTGGDPLTAAYHAMDEAVHDLLGATMFAGIETGLLFAGFLRGLRGTFPERLCPACRGLGTPDPHESVPTDCAACAGAGYVPARFGPETTTEGR